MGIQHSCHQGINRPKREAHSLSHKAECLKAKLDFHYTGLWLCATGKKNTVNRRTSLLIYRDEKTLQITNELHGFKGL
jgi:hypothetical protein